MREALGVMLILGHAGHLIEAVLLLQINVSWFFIEEVLFARDGWLAERLDRVGSERLHSLGIFRTMTRSGHSPAG